MVTWVGGYRVGQSPGRTMLPRDRRRKLLGFVVGDADDLVILDVSRAPVCTRCRAPLELRTVPMTGQTIEVCRRCDTSHPVARFRPVEEQELPGPTA